MMILDILTIYPLAIIIASIFYSFISQNFIGILFAIGSIIEIIFNMGLKKITNYMFPKFKPFLRPNPPNIGCGYIPNCNNTILTYGMPSGHAQSAATIAVFWVLYILDNYSLNIYSYLSIISLILVSMMVAYSRIYLGCHNILQVFVGSIIGLIYGVVLYKIINMLSKKDK